MHNIKIYKDLDVWKKAVGLTKLVYIVSKNFPKEEQYGLIAQILPKEKCGSSRLNILDSCIFHWVFVEK